MSERTGRLAVPPLAPPLVPAVAAALALVLLLGIGVAALRTPVSSAATVLLRGGAVVATLEDGTRRPLAEGDEVPRGAVVTAGRDGAVLRTRDRDAWLSADAALRVVDGATQELRSGFVMVDARRGPGVEVRTDAAVVDTPDGAVTRVESGRRLRVGSYSGDAARVQAAARTAAVDVGPSHQVQVDQGALPGRVTPLVLTPGDAYERALAADLVAADEALTALADRLDVDGRAAALVRTAADTDAVPADLPADTPASERTLAYLLARAAGAPFADVRALRADGGSWGVVADLVDAEVSAVARLLDALLGTPEAVLAAEEVDVVDLLGAPDAPVDVAPSTTPTPPVAAPAPAAPAPPPPPGDGDEPTTAPDPGPTGVLDAVVDTVLGLLPLQPATGPTAPALPGHPPASPTPSPTPTGGLLGVLTG